MSSLTSVVVSCALFASTNVAVAQSQRAHDALAPLNFLMGSWGGENGRGEVTSSGQFSVRRDLAGKILVRRDVVTYSVDSKTRRPLTILIVFAPRDSVMSYQANYFDSDGHVLNFVSTRVVPDSVAEFVSAPVADPMIFRLTYTRVRPNAVRIAFERADAHAPETFTTVVQGVARRRESATRKTSF